MGEYVGKVKDLRRDSLVVAGTASFANGDGLCYLNAKHELEGFRVNRAVGNRLFPHQMPAGLRPGLALYRNQDQAFERLLQGRSAERRLSLRMLFSATEDGFRLVASMDEASASVDIAFEHQAAKSPQKRISYKSSASSVLPTSRSVPRTSRWRWGHGLCLAACWRRHDGRWSRSCRPRCLLRFPFPSLMKW